MPKFAANLTMLFTELPFLDRFRAASEAGFEAVECLFPYDYPAREIAARLENHGLSLVLFDLPAGDWAAGERGIGCHPGRDVAFRESVKQAVEYAHHLGCQLLNCLAGIPPQGVGFELARETFIANMAFAADRLAQAGLTLLIEPINSYDMPGYFINHTASALDVMDAVSAPNLKLQYDIYHAQVMEGNLTRTIERLLPRIGHIQLADHPGRHEPGTGEINYPFLLNRIDALGYDGWIGCEYKPLGSTLAGLAWRDSPIPAR